MAASLPGVQLVPGADGDPSGFSVLGLTPDQNNSTLNGQNFGGANLPRDAGVSELAGHVAVRCLARWVQRGAVAVADAERLELLARAR